MKHGLLGKKAPHSEYIEKRTHSQRTLFLFEEIFLLSLKPGVIAIFFGLPILDIRPAYGNKAYY